MRRKLLSFSKNLIIVLGLVVLIMLIFTTSSYAASEKSLGTVMRQTISDWYRFISNICIVVYIVGYLVIVLRLLGDRTPDNIRTLKESIARFLIMLAVIFFLHFIMIAIIAFNEQGIKLAQTAGSDISGTDMRNNEVDLYETALTKAYEISAVPGIIGLVMYLILVFYTYKFVFIYVKRYINIIILILLAPIIFVASTIKRIVTGVNDGRITRWFKEFIFNVTLQTLHALFYSILIGYTLKYARNDDTLILSLIALILLGFIFKIDGIIRKLFNIVGGSTKINTSRTAGRVIDTVGCTVNAGLGAISGGTTKFGENLDEKGLKDGFKQSFKDVGDFAKRKAGETVDEFKGMPASIKQKSINFGNDVKEKAANAYAEVKDDWKDRKNILNGERVKANLTADEKVAAVHEMAEAKGLEELRQKVHKAGNTVVVSSKKLDDKFSKVVEKAYKEGDRRVKAGINAVTEEFYKDVKLLKLENEVELIKKLPKIIKKQQMLKATRGKVELDTTSAMMFMVDFKFDSKALIEDIKNEYQKGNPILYKAFEKVGAQMLLSPKVASAKFGLSVLSEANREKAVEHKVEELANGKTRKKRTIKKAKVKGIKVQGIEQFAYKSEKISETGEIVEKKRYTFSRFSETSARKITNRMLGQVRENNKYLATLHRVSKQVESETLKVRGRADEKTVDIEHKIKMTRKDQVTAVRKLKLNQQQEVTKHKELVQQTRKVEMANHVAGQVMTAKNAIRLGFMQIDQMTSGQTGMRMMAEAGRIQQLPNGLVVINQVQPNQATLNQNISVEDRIAATGLVTKEKPEQVVQFVLTEEGKIVPQVVTKEGKLEAPMVRLEQNLQAGQVVRAEQTIQTHQHVITQFVQTLEPKEQVQVVERFSEVLNQYIKPVEVGNPIVSLQNMQQEEKAEVLQNVLQVFTQAIPGAEKVNTVELIKNMEPEAQDQAIVGMVSVLSQYVQKTEDGTPKLVLDTLEPEQKVQVIQNVFEVFTKVEQTEVQVPQEPIQFTTILGKVKPQEQAHIIQNFSEIVNQYVKPTEIGNPVVAIANMPVEEKTVMLQNVVTVVSQYVPVLKQQEATTIVANMQPEAQNQVIQGIIQVFSEHNEVAEEGSLAVKLEPSERKQIIQEIAQIFTENIVPNVEEKPQVESKTRLVSQAESQIEPKTKQEQEVPKAKQEQEVQKVQQEQTIQGVFKMLEQYMSTVQVTDTAVEAEAQTSEEKLKTMNKIVENIAPTEEGKIIQQIVTLEGDIVEQTIDIETNTIEAESYKYIGKSDESVLQQIQNIPTNNELGLPQDASLEERATAFSNLIDDINRENDTKNILDAILPEASENVVLEESKEEDKVLLNAMEEAKITTVADLKKVMYFDQENPDERYITPDEKDKEALRQSKEVFEKVIENRTVTNMPSESSDVDDDILGEAIDKLNNITDNEAKVDSADIYDRAESLNPGDAESLLETAAEMERVRIASELMNNGGFTEANPPTDSDIDATVESKMSGLSELLVGLSREAVDESANWAKETVDEATAFPREVIEQTVEDFVDVVANEQKEYAENEYRKELEKAEKKWAKKHGKEADNSVVDEYALGKSEKKKGKGDSDDENATIKITLKFYGAVKNQGQSVILSNHYSIKDFYDRADKLEDANYVKTEERFMQTYGSKLKQMQLANFSFAKNPVEDMDGWSIYIVSDKEDIEPETEKTKKEEPVGASVTEIVEKYSLGLRTLFKKFIEEFEITSFDDIYDEPSNVQELVRRVRMFLFRRDEKNENEKAIEIVNKLYKLVEYKNIIREANRDRIAKADSEEAVKNAKSKIKITNKEKAEHDAANEFTESEIKNYKEKQKSSLLDQILGGININPKSEEAEETVASFEVQELLSRMTDSLYADLGIKNDRTQEKKVLQFDDEGDN